MEIFFSLLSKLLPLYGLIFLGFLGKKIFNLNQDKIAWVLIYIILPVVFFTGVFTTKLTVSTLSLPFLFMLVCCFIALFTYYLSGFFWKDSTRNILGFTLGSANTGYFGIPVAAALFGQQAVGIVALILLGTSLYTGTFGYFLAAKGHHTTKDSLIKVLKLPIIYCFLLGLVINFGHIQLPDIYFKISNLFQWAITFLGMMLIGIGIADIKEFKFDFKFIGFSLPITFLLWPLIILLIIYLDAYTLHIYDASLHKIMLLVSIVPPAANIVSYANILKSHPEKTSLLIFVSTIFALFYIPLIAYFFFR